MQITVKKTDKRFAGNDRYKYYVDIIKSWKESGSVKEEFFKLRVWCWETWGPSREVDQLGLGGLTGNEGDYIADRNPAWSWINDEHRMRLYLGNKEEAAHFALRWS